MTVPSADCVVIAPLLPWYVNGTLEHGGPGDGPSGEGMRQRVAAHLAVCPACRALVDGPQAFRDMARDEAPARLLEHVSSRLIVDYVETPGALVAATISSVKEHLEGCGPCREAAAILRDMSTLPVEALRAGGPETGRLESAPHRPSLVARIWDLLSRSILRPLPALAYLVVVLLLLPAVGRRFIPGPVLEPAPAAPVTTAPGPGPERSAASVVPPPQRVDARDSYRSVMAPAGGGPAILRVEPGLPLLIEVDPDLDRGDLDAPGAAFDVSITIGGRTVAHATARTADFDARGRVRLLISGDLVPPHSDGEIVVARAAALPGGGSASTGGEVLFRRRFTTRP
jgi:hypothetical protein